MACEATGQNGHANRYNKHYIPQRINLGANRVAQHAEDLCRYRFHSGQAPEDGDGDIIERYGECEKRTGNDRGHQKGQRHMKERLHRVGP